MRTRNFLKDFLTMGTGTLLYMVVGLIGTPILTRLVEPEAYGQASLLTVYGSMGLMFCGLGLDQALLRHFYTGEADHRRHLLRLCWSTALVPALTAGVLLCLAGTGEARLLAAYIPVLLLHRFATLTLRLQNRNRTYCAVNIFQKAAAIALSVGLLLLGWDHFPALAVAAILATALAALWAIIAEHDLWLRPGFGSLCRPVLLRYGLPMMLASSIHVVFAALDRLFIRHCCTMAEVGIYAGAVNLMAVFSLVRTSFTAIWMPAAVAHYEDDPEDRRFYRNANGLISFLMLSLGAAVAAGKDLFVVLLGEQYRSAAPLVPLLMFEPILYTISETTATGMVVRKKTRYQIIAAGGACAVNFLGNALLTPGLGAPGAALSTAFSYFVFWGLRTWLSGRVFPVDYGLGRFALSAGALVLFALYAAAHPFTPVQIPLALGVVAIAFLCYRRELFALGKAHSFPLDANQS